MRRVQILFLLLSSFLICSTAQERSLIESKVFSNLGDYARQAEFSPYRNYFAFTIGNNTLRIYNRDWEKVFEHQGNPRAVGGIFAFSPDEKYMAYGRYKGTNDIAIVQLEDMKVIQVLNKHSDYITHLEFSHDGRHLASTSADKQLIIWYSYEEVFHHSNVITDVERGLNESSFSYDDRYLVTGDDYGNVLVLSKEPSGSYTVVQKFKNRRHSVESIVFHPQKYEFITGSSYGIRRYKLEEDQFVFTDSVVKNAYISYPMHFSPDGTFLAAGSHNTAVRYHVNPDSIYTLDILYRHAENVFGANFSDDGKFFTTYSSDQSVIIWESAGIWPSPKSEVVSWLNGDLTLAQRRVLKPASVDRIIKAVDASLTFPKKEFEKTSAYMIRKDKLADHTTFALQKEMEKQYKVKEKLKVPVQYVEIPVQGLVGYNADLEIYKIKFMDTEAGVSIPVPSAIDFYNRWTSGYIRAVKKRVSGQKSFRYESFELFHPKERKFYPVTPLENPFHREEKNSISRNDSQHKLEQDRSPEDQPGKNYALMFATNVYDSYSDLVNPVLDAQTIAAELGESYGVISEVVLNPTLSQTAEKIREFATRSYMPEDNLMIFFAGHGVYDEVFREGYVISRDSQMDDAGKTSYLSHSNLRTMINNIDCPHIFLVMDVCFGGTFDPHLASVHRGASAVYGDISTQEFVDRKLKYKTRLYLTSGGKEYVPDGRPGFHSPFARKLIESLRYYGGDDGVLTTSEILQFVEKVNPQPRFGEFGDNEPGSDFILVVK